MTTTTIRSNAQKKHDKTKRTPDWSRTLDALQNGRQHLVLTTKSSLLVNTLTYDQSLRADQCANGIILRATVSPIVSTQSPIFQV